MDLIHKIIAASGEVKEIEEVLKKEDARLQKTKESELTQLLANLSPADHTLGYIRILSYMAKEGLKDIGTFARLASGLLLKGTNLHLDKPRVYKIGKHFGRACIMGSPKSGILPLKRAIDQMCAKKPHILTPLHDTYVLLCILTKCYNSALSVIAVPKYEIEPKANRMTMTDYLCYYYYSGKVCCVLKRWEDALEHFQAVLTAPSDGCISAIQIEAYKKHMLVSLLLHGEVVALPKQVTNNGVIGKCKEQAGQEYQTIRFGAKDSVAEVTRKATEAKQVFVKDENWGLVKQVLAAMADQKIQKLNKTYATLSFKDVARLADLEDEKEAETKLAHMIEDGKINAVICTKDRMVTFRDDDHAHGGRTGSGDGDEEVAMKLKNKIHEAFELSAKLREIDYKIKTDPMFVKRNSMASSRKEVVYPTHAQTDHAATGYGMSESQQLRHALEKSKFER